MPPLNLILAAFKRSGFPEAVAQNCLVEVDPVAGTAALIARFGLETFATVGVAPIRCVFQKQGLFGDDALILASETLYRVSASGAVTAFTGSIPGDRLVDIDGGFDADGGSIARIANGTGLYLVSGTTVAQEDFPEDAGVNSVQYFSGYWLAVQANTDYCYRLKPAETVWSALEFDGAELQADRLKGVRVVGSIAWLPGESSLEGWRVTGNPSSPLERYGGLEFNVGCLNLNSAVNCRDTFIFVDSDCSVRLTGGGSPEIISDHGLAEQIRRTNPADIRASFFIKDQHPLYVLTLGTSATWVYDLGQKRWTTANSATRDYWRADLFCNIGGTVLARDALSNTIYRVDPDVYTDAGETFTMEFMGYLPVKEGIVQIANLQMDCEVGGSPRTGQGSAPLAVLQKSGDSTKTWGSPREKSLGATGKYLTRVRFVGLGQARAPHGAWFRFSISDPVKRRISGVYANVP